MFYTNSSDLNNLNSVESRVAVQFTVQPFSDSNKGRFAANGVYDFSLSDLKWDSFVQACNAPDMFADSAMIITDAEYAKSGYTDIWSHSFEDGMGKYLAWTELTKCALSEAQDVPNKYSGVPEECKAYLQAGRSESTLTNILNRKKCPMIPNFGHSDKSTALPVDIANAFTQTLQPFTTEPEPQVIRTICNVYFYSFQPIYNGLPEEKEPQTIPNSVICYYDVILALDLDCADFNENPVIGDFAVELVDTIFGKFENRIIDGAIRIGIVGFHSELEIAMNLFELSSHEGRSKAHENAHNAIKDLQSFALSRRNYKTSSFIDTFQNLAALFDARDHKVRELYIISNASPGQFTKGDWSEADLDRLKQIKSDSYSDIIIRTVPVNKVSFWQPRL